MKSSQATINELISGSFGGAAQVLVGQPLDTIKTRAQIAPSAYHNCIPSTSFAECFQLEGMFVSLNLIARRTSTLFWIDQNGPMDILKQTVRKEGFFALYKGTYLLSKVQALSRPTIPC